MIITILNGNMQPEPNGFSIYVSDLTRQLQKDHTVNHFQLREMRINLHFPNFVKKQIS